MYPRQPFDFAGRTGTVVFDVSDNSQGSHGAWPAFAITSLPVPAPDGNVPLIEDAAPDSVGFALDGLCGQGGCVAHGDVSVGGSNYPPGARVDSPAFTCVTVGSVYETIDYREHSVPFTVRGCVLPSPAVGTDNHVQVRIGPHGIAVFASDPGKRSTTRLIATADFKVPLTRGLVWLEDVHDNADKVDSQRSNSFSWSDVGFDGPVLPRDLGFDVPDAHLVAGDASGPVRAANGLPTFNLGYGIPAGGSLTVRVPNVSGVERAVGALLVFNYFTSTPRTVTVSVNGNSPLRLSWPGTPAGGGQDAGIVVPLSQVHDGANTIVFGDLGARPQARGVDVANIDLVALGAGGIVRP
jgi:hypothetical protein